MSSSNKAAEKRQHDLLLGKYELGRLLGRGTFAKVYSAKSINDSSSSSSVAIKVLDKPEILSSGVGPMILREVSAMRSLSHHPNILKLHEVMATRSKIYLVMEHARGGELFSHLARSGRLPEPAARRYFQQLISALRFCHSHGVTHRDVKPENLLLDRHGNLKLSDFGLSALPEQLRGDGMLHTTCGTPAYTAPEVFRRKGYDGSKADAWSCGVFLYVLLAGFLPFDDSNIALMYRRAQKREYRVPPWFSPSVRKVLSRLLDPNPETRVSLDGLFELPWIRRAYSVDQNLNLLNYLPPVDGGEEFGVSTASVSASDDSAVTMNAFDIIALSSGLDLSGMFDEEGRRRERRFTSVAGVEKVLERVKEIGAKFGYAVEKKKQGGVKSGSVVVLSVEVSEVAPPILLVELRVEGGGEKSLCSWGELREELGDVVFDWHDNGVDS